MFPFYSEYFSEQTFCIDVLVRECSFADVFPEKMVTTHTYSVACMHTCLRACVYLLVHACVRACGCKCVVIMLVVIIPTHSQSKPHTNIQLPRKSSIYQYSKHCSIPRMGYTYPFSMPPRCISMPPINPSFVSGVALRSRPALPAPASALPLRPPTQVDGLHIRLQGKYINYCN